MRDKRVLLAAMNFAFLFYPFWTFSNQNHSECSTFNVPKKNSHVIGGIFKHLSIIHVG